MMNLLSPAEAIVRDIGAAAGLVGVKPIVSRVRVESVS